MAEPKRIQRQRAKGWRMPDGAIYVGRPTRWGNPYRVAHEMVVDTRHDHEYVCAPGARHAVATRHFREDLVDGRLDISLDDLDALRGHDLACWCPLDAPCHADVLLELANGAER